MSHLVFRTQTGLVPVSECGSFAFVSSSDSHTLTVEVTGDEEGKEFVPVLKIGSESCPLVRKVEEVNAAIFEIPQRWRRFAQRRTGSLTFFKDSKCMTPLRPTLVVASNVFNDKILHSIFASLYDLVIDPNSLLREKIQKPSLTRREQSNLVSQLTELGGILRRIEELVSLNSVALPLSAKLVLGKTKPSELLRRGLGAFLTSRNDDARFISGPERTTGTSKGWESVLPIFEDVMRLRNHFESLVKELTQDGGPRTGELSFLAKSREISNQSPQENRSAVQIIEEITLVWMKISEELHQVDDELLEVQSHYEGSDALVEIRSRIAEFFDTDIKEFRDPRDEWFGLGEDALVSSCFSEDGFLDDTRIFERWFVAMAIRSLFRFGFEPHGDIPSLEAFLGPVHKDEGHPTTWLHLSRGKGVSVSIAYEPPLSSSTDGDVKIGGRREKGHKTPDLVIGVNCSDGGGRFSRIAIFDAKYSNVLSSENKKQLDNYARIGLTDFVVAALPSRKDNLITRDLVGNWVLKLCPNPSISEVEPLLRHFLCNVFMNRNLCVICGSSAGTGQSQESVCQKCRLIWHWKRCKYGASDHGYYWWPSVTTKKYSAYRRSQIFATSSRCPYCTDLKTSRTPLAGRYWRE
jgi:hypothetical protein